jgi:hypothetical protein
MIFRLTLVALLSLVSRAESIDNTSVLKMVRDKVSVATILQRIAETTPAYDTTPNGLDALVYAGVPDQVIRAIAARQAGRPIPGLTTAHVPVATPPRTAQSGLGSVAVPVASPLPTALGGSFVSSSLPAYSGTGSSRLITQADVSDRLQQVFMRMTSTEAFRGGAALAYRLSDTEYWREIVTAPNVVSRTFNFPRPLLIVSIAMPRSGSVVWPLLGLAHLESPRVSARLGRLSHPASLRVSQSFVLLRVVGATNSPKSPTRLSSVILIGHLDTYDGASLRNNFNSAQQWIAHCRCQSYGYRSLRGS